MKLTIYYYYLRISWYKFIILAIEELPRQVKPFYTEIIEIGWTKIGSALVVHW